MDPPGYDVAGWVPAEMEPLARMRRRVAAGRASAQRVNEIGLPASTLMMLPVDLAERSLARK